MPALAAAVPVRLPSSSVDEGDVTAEWLSAILGEDVIAVDRQRIGDGLVGLNVRVTLERADPSLARSVVIKLPSTDATSRATGIALRNYEREVCFYRDLARTVDIRVPLCHHGEWDPATGDFVLVLEDMTPAETGDQVAGCDVGRAAAAVAELARLHGPRWDDPSLSAVEWLGRWTGPEDTQQLKTIWDMVLPGFVATYARHLDSEAHELIEWFSSALPAWVEGREGPLAVTHGDYRLDNLLFGVDGGAPPVTVVDWQTPGHHPPISDLAYFCGAGLVPEVRRRHEHQLLAVYVEGLDGYGVGVDDRWLWEQYRREAFAGVVMAVVASQIVGGSERSEAMFAAMATRHAQHAIDLDAAALV